MLHVVRIVLLRINYEPKLKLKASVILVLLIIIVVILFTRLSLLADDAAAWTVGDIARCPALLAPLAMTMKRKRGRGGSWPS